MTADDRAIYINDIDHFDVIYGDIVVTVDRAGREAFREAATATTPTWYGLGGFEVLLGVGVTTAIAPHVDGVKIFRDQTK